MTKTHAVTWIDSDEAKIIYVSPGATETNVTLPTKSRHHIGQNAGQYKSDQAVRRHVFFQKVANELASVSFFVVVGPEHPKSDFIRHLRLYNPRLIPRLSAVDSVDDPTDETLAALARRHLKPVDDQALSPGQP